MFSIDTCIYQIIKISVLAGLIVRGVKGPPQTLLTWTQQHPLSTQKPSTDRLDFVRRACLLPRHSVSRLKRRKLFIFRSKASGPPF